MSIIKGENTQTYRTCPELGQLVEVRRRQWVVANVVPSQLNDIAEMQNYVTLMSIGEDALGEELEVIWEIEPGAQIIERAGFPSITGQDDSNTLDAFLNAVRWGAATNADRGFLQAPFRSGIAIEDYQLDPLVRTIDMARVNLLIADDVGLGNDRDPVGIERAGQLRGITPVVDVRDLGGGEGDDRPHLSTHRGRAMSLDRRVDPRRGALLHGIRADRRGADDGFRDRAE